MPRFGLVMDPRFEEHDTGPGHPERPARLQVVRAALEHGGLASTLERLPLVAATDDELLAVHDRAHVERVERACAAGQPIVDSMDTAIGPASAEIARLAAGSLLALCRRTAAGELAGGFAALRPPGHHAERDLAMGFCLYNHVAIAARDLVTRHGLERVAIVDWDVHHGNGTQHLFEEDGRVFFFSLHQWPLYPGTGRRDERGRGAGEGTTLNVPLPPGAGDDAFLAALRDEAAPALDAYRPELILISAGFDAHRRDPLGGLQVSTGAYAEATRIVCGIARRHSQGRVVSTLEGGYDLEALGESVRLHVETLRDEVGA